MNFSKVVHAGAICINPGISNIFYRICVEEESELRWVTRYAHSSSVSHTFNLEIARSSFTSLEVFKTLVNTAHICRFFSSDQVVHIHAYTAKLVIRCW